MSCPDCFRGGAATGTPTGTTRMLHGFNTYIASPSESQEESAAKGRSTIILYTDAFGHLLPNNLLLAEALSLATNFTVLVPDIIPGGGMSPSILPLMDTFSSPTSGVLSKAWAMGRAMVHVIPFFVRASPQSEGCTVPCLEYARKVGQEMHEQGKGGKLGLAGYCWGGYQALNIAGTEGEKVVDAVFVAHPAKFEPRHAVEAVQKGVMVSFAHAGDDMSLPMVKIEETKKVLEGSGGFDSKIYEDCVHGFAVRATPGKEKEGKAADEALKQAVDWFGKFL